MKDIIFLIGSLFLMTQLLRYLFKLKEQQFDLLKLMFPEELKGVKSYFSFIVGFRGFALPSAVLFWMYTPLYYKANFVRIAELEKIQTIDKKLVNTNKKLANYLIALITWLFVVGMMLF